MKKNDCVVIEIDERIAVTDSEPFQAYCSECKAMAQMATPKTAGVIAEISEREVFRLIEGKEVHFIENARVLVCVESLRGPKADFNTTSG